MSLSSRLAVYLAGGLSPFALAGALQVVAPHHAPQTAMLLPATLVDAAAPTSPVSPATPATTLADLAARDPRALTRLGRERYEREIHDYRCMLTKQERLGSQLSPVQEIEVRYDESPRMVYMIWHRNPDRVKRALFVDSERYVDRKGRKVARVEPAGAILRLFVSEALVPIHGPDAQKASRRTIDEFGFKSTFMLFERINALAEKNGDLDLRYEGEGRIDQRPTFVVVRHLPYAGDKGPYPDATLVMHIDQGWLLPVAIYAYADQARQRLLGSYVFTDIELNPGFGADAFRF